MKLLLIEDDQVIADFINKGMNEAGFAIDHMPDGQLGLSAALNFSYDLAIIDLMLPKTRWHINNRSYTSKKNQITHYHT